jgi:hypothetical protein
LPLQVLRRTRRRGDLRRATRGDRDDGAAAAPIDKLDVVEKWITVPADVGEVKVRIVKPVAPPPEAGTASKRHIFGRCPVFIGRPQPAPRASRQRSRLICGPIPVSRTRTNHHEHAFSVPR